MTQNKSKFFSIFDSVLFVLIMIILALRLSSSENPLIESFSLLGTSYDNILSVCISSLLIILSTIWLAVRLSGGKYRLSGLEYGILIFIAAVVLSTISASNHRAAITDSITILSAMLTGVVLSNLLGTIERKKILLFVLAGMAIANVYQCTEQCSGSNKFMIEEYENEPLLHLSRLGIEPGSFEQTLYEHRLYSKDVRGFFTTGNGAGCLLVFAIFCVLAAFDLRAGWTFKKIWLPAALLLVLLAGMVMAHSKGAFGSLIAAGFVLLLVIKFGNVLYRHRILIIISVIIIIILGAGLLIGYGLWHHRLPGGNSMLVRWQYWYSTAKIIAAHPVTGVGGGNFAEYYSLYKLPQSLESVRDPHCFAMSILSQYGFIGLAGFCIAAFYPLIKGCRPADTVQSAGNNIIAAAKISGICIVAALLFVRPIFIRAPIGDTNDVRLYIIIVTYVAPAFFAGTILWLCARNQGQYKHIGDIFRPALLCGLLALLIHNLIDFAIFEPGIMTAFWAGIAIIQSDFRSKEPVANERSPKTITKFILLITPVAIGVSLLWLCIIPGVKMSINMEKAKQLREELRCSCGKYEQVIELLNNASADDILNPVPAGYAGKILLTEFKRDPSSPPDILNRAEKLLQTAIDRDKADFKNYENLGKVCEALAMTAAADGRQDWLKKAFSSYEQAVRRYPASSELHFELAQIAQQLDNNDIAIEHYAKAVEIEDAFAEQYKIMYPDLPACNRMKNAQYRQAKEELEALVR